MPILKTIKVDVRKSLFSVSEVAQLAGVSLTTVYEDWKDGKFPSSSKVGTMHIITQYDMLAYCAARNSEEVE